MEKGEPSRTWCTRYLSSWANLSKSYPNIAYELVDAPDDASNFKDYSSGQMIMNKSPSSERTMPLLIRAFNNSYRTTKKLSAQWDGLKITVNRMSTILAFLSGLLYITARVILLAVAFAAFRKQNEDLYIDTWARFMPSWR